MGFELAQMSSPPVDAVMKVGDGEIVMQLDADIITGDFLEEMKSLVQKEVDAGMLVEESKQARFMAEVLSRIVKKWDVEDRGKSVAPTVKFFMARPVKLTGEIFAFAMDAISPKKTTETT